MEASYIGHLDVVKTLIEAGANVNHTNKVGTCTLLLHTNTVLLYCLSSASLCACSCHNDVLITCHFSVVDAICRLTMYMELRWPWRLRDQTLYDTRFCD